MKPAFTRCLQWAWLCAAVAAALVVAGCGKKDDPVAQAARQDAAKGASAPGIAETKAIAEEAFVYGLPLVMNYAVMQEFVVDKNSGQYKGPFNEISNEARVFTYKDTAVVTPNSDTPYSMLWLDLRSEPMVISVPAVEKERYYSVQLTDGNAYNYGYIGSRATGVEAGDYLVVGPGWKGETPGRLRADLPVDDAVRADDLSHTAFERRRHAQCREGAGGIPGAAAIRILEPACAAGSAQDRLPAGVDCGDQGELLRVPRCGAAVRAGDRGGQGDPRPARDDRHRTGQDLRLQGTLARAQGCHAAGDEGGRRQGRRVPPERNEGRQRLEGRLDVRRSRLLPG